MKQLLEGFHLGKPVPTIIWNDTGMRLTKPRYDNLQSSVLQAVLTTLPKDNDHKQRMDTAQAITKSVMAVVANELTK